VRRLLPILANALTVLSLLVCLATVLLWVRAKPMADLLVYYSGRAGHTFMAYRDGMEYLQWPEDVDDPKTWLGDNRPSHSLGWHYQKTYAGQGGSGFTYVHRSASGDFNIGLPYWFICLITALAPAARLTSRLRRKRPPPGLCPKCHYDLRATADRCPECGTVTKPAEPA